MNGLRRMVKTVFTPVTIMLVPHARTKAINLRVPFAGIVLSVVMFCVGTAYILSVSVRTWEYYRMQERLNVASSQLLELRATMHSLKVAESEFRKLFALKSKKEVLEAADFSDTGSLDMDVIRKQIDEAVSSVGEIKKYIAAQRDIYLATPRGLPVPGRISSGYGIREHPRLGGRRLHSGLDISVPLGTSVRATADGVVSFAGWTAGSGNVVVVEHGHGFSTAYAHNSKNLVKVGAFVKRDDVVALAGSTGISTGPHVHYEIWKNGAHINPSSYLAGG